MRFCVFILATILSFTVTAKSKTNEAESQEEKVSSLADALKRGKLAVNLRYRFEYVTDDTAAVTGKDAKASTLRMALNYRSHPIYGFAGFLEFENISVIGKNSYNNKGAGHLANGVTDRPAIADPKLTEVNQVYFSLTMIPETTIHIGREEILLDNVRFIGNVGWRQNHQSFDDISVVNTLIPKTTITYAHLFRVNRIFGDYKPMNSNLFNVSIRISESTKLSAYSYLLDYDNENDFGLSTNTYGISFTGKQRLKWDWDFLYELEYAKQVDAFKNTNSIDADYYRLQVGAAHNNIFAVNVGHEVLGGSPEYGQFNTPLATLHPWNGWADRFPITPLNGLQDTYFSLGGNPGKFELTGIYHWFRADEGSIKYGRELDLLIAYNSPWKQLFAFKVALYRANLHAADTNKLMFYTTYNF